MAILSILGWLGVTHNDESGLNDNLLCNNWIPSESYYNPGIWFSNATRSTAPNFYDGLGDFDDPSEMQIADTLVIWINNDVDAITMAPTSIPTSQPTGWTVVNNGYFIGVYPDGEKISWSTALTYCETEFNTSLATILNENDNFNGTDAVIQAGVTSMAWFGLNDIKNDTIYVFSDGTPLTNNSYQNWADGQPDNFGSYEHCIHWFVNDGKWNDIDCSGGGQVEGFACNLPR